MDKTSSSKAGSAALTHKERVDRALRGQDLDRPLFTFYHHYKRPNAQLEAQDHLEFHRTYNIDIVQGTSDFDYPQSTTASDMSSSRWTLPSRTNWPHFDSSAMD
jgi:hypothetical protein